MEGSQVNKFEQVPCEHTDSTDNITFLQSGAGGKFIVLESE